MRRTVLVLFLTSCVAKAVRSSLPNYTNVWAVEVEGGKERADALAKSYNFENKGQVGILENVYEFWLAEYIYEREGIGLNEPYHQITELLLDQQEYSVQFAEQQILRTAVPMSYTPPNDPYWNKQWVLLNDENRGLREGKANTSYDLNIEPAWIQGCTGKDVVVGIVDDGVDFNHIDLFSNYDTGIDYNALNTTRDHAYPEDQNGITNHHGTNCAGVVAMTKNNGKCGVGIAYESTVTGILVIGSRGLTDIMEAKALSHNYSIIDIYSNSWGLEDDGTILQSPARCTEKTLKLVAEKGRDGKGSIFVWAAGNGGDADLDNRNSCAANGYVNNIYTIAIGSANSEGERANYDERCSAKMTTAFVQNRFANFNRPLHVATAGVNQTCYPSFGGTSAATPVVSATIALTLQANNNLTWRDVQYLIVYTSNPDILMEDDLDGDLWVTNGAGLRVSHSFGFGAIDAEAMVTRARHWVNVPQQRTFTEMLDIMIDTNGTELIQYTFNQESIAWLEHVVLSMSLSFEDNTEKILAKRGDIQLELTSPQGTKSILLPYRARDTTYDEGYNEWPFMSVHFWGEDPSGNWTLNVTYRGPFGTLLIRNVTFTFLGTAIKPPVIARIPSKCDSACARGCAAPGPEYCDSCNRNYVRNATTLECIQECPDGFKTTSGYCYNPSEAAATCVRNFEKDSVSHNSNISNIGLHLLIVGMLNVFVALVY